MPEPSASSGIGSPSVAIRPSSGAIDDALAFRSHKFNVQTEYALSSISKLQVSGGLVETNRFDGQVGEVTSNSVRPSLGYANVLYERGEFLIRAWWSGYTDDATINPSPQLVNLIRITDRNGSSTNPFSGNTYNVDVQHAADLWSTNRLLYGINYRHNSLSSSAIDQFSREDRLGLFFQDEWRPTVALTIVAGVRYDLHTQINGTWSPRVTILYQPVEGHTFHLSGSAAYRPPTLFESHQDQRVTTTIPTGLPFPFPPRFLRRFRSTGSTRLAPEQIISYEAGYQGWYWKHRLRLRADLFFNHVSDLIGSRIASSGASEFVNDQGSADIYGGEAGIEFLASRWLSGFANYAYEEIGQSFSGTVRRGAPRSKVSAGLRTEWDNGLSGEISYYYVGATTLSHCANLHNTWRAFRDRCHRAGGSRRQLQPAQSARRISILATEGRGRVHARCRSGFLGLQCAERQASRTSARRPDRQKSDGMVDSQILRRRQPDGIRRGCDGTNNVTPVIRSSSWTTIRTSPSGCKTCSTTTVIR